jgi:hypothetical protein
MARDPELLKLRDKRIREVFDRMRAKRSGGKRMYTSEYIVHHISTEHVFISTRVIERVIYGK